MVPVEIDQVLAVSYISSSVEQRPCGKEQNAGAHSQSRSLGNASLPGGRVGNLERKVLCGLGHFGLYEVHALVNGMTVNFLAPDFHIRCLVEPEVNGPVLLEQIEVEVSAKEARLRLHRSSFLLGQLTAFIYMVHKDRRLVDGYIDIAPRIELRSPFSAHSNCGFVVGTAVDQFVVHLLP